MTNGQQKAPWHQDPDESSQLVAPDGTSNYWWKQLPKVNRLEAEKEGLAMEVARITGLDDYWEAEAARLEAEKDALAEERYLSVECPVCGRMRLCYLPATNKLWCEKCEADNDVLADASPHDRLEQAEARAEKLAEALLMVIGDGCDYEYEHLVVHLRAIAAAALHDYEAAK